MEKTDWFAVVKGMEHRESCKLTEVQAIALRRAAKKLGYNASRTPIKNSKLYRVSVFKDKNDISWITYRFKAYKQYGIEDKHSNWDVDITKLPIPASAFPRPEPSLARK